MGFLVQVPRQSTLKRPGAEVTCLDGPAVEVGRLHYVNTGSAQDWQLLRGERYRVRQVAGAPVTVQNTGRRTICAEFQDAGFAVHENIPAGHSWTFEGYSVIYLLDDAPTFDPKKHRKRK